MEGTKQGKIRLGGIPANLFAFPLLVVITLLHIALVLLKKEEN